LGIVSPPVPCPESARIVYPSYALPSIKSHNIWLVGFSYLFRQFSAFEVDASSLLVTQRSINMLLVPQDRNRTQSSRDNSNNQKPREIVFSPEMHSRIGQTVRN
jgi:hypothetical protein